MNKTVKKIIAKEVNAKGNFLLGKDADGVKYWLAKASWDCGWYWGFGYVQTKDSHEHIDSSFLGKLSFYNTEKKVWDYTEYIHNIYDTPRLTEVTFTESEGWVLSELFFTFYTLKKAAEMWHTGGAHITTNPLLTLLKRPEEEKHINENLMPKLFAEVSRILVPTKPYQP
jgi:hypothetical protein